MNAGTSVGAFLSVPAVLFLAGMLIRSWCRAPGSTMIETHFGKGRGYMLRHFKIVAAIFVGLLGTLVFLGNLLNLEAAHSAVSFVVAAEEQPVYRVIGPVAEAAWLGWLGLAVIMGCELAVGILGLTGAMRMVRALGAGAEDFRSAASLAILAGLVGMLLWYGVFIVLGEGYFHMWQHEVGLGSVEGAFRYGTVSAVLAAFIASRDDAL